MKDGRDTFCTHQRLSSMQAMAHQMSFASARFDGAHCGHISEDPGR